jgi:hypothetical protein
MLSGLGSGTSMRSMVLMRGGHIDGVYVGIADEFVN